MRMRSALVMASALTCLGACDSASVGKAATGASDLVCNGMDASEVLRQIKSKGADLAHEREGVFYFYGPEARLASFQAALEQLGFSVRPTRTDSGRIGTINTVIDEHWMRQMMPKICKLSAQHGVDYDGWEASIPEAQTKH